MKLGVEVGHDETFWRNACLMPCCERARVNSHVPSTTGRRTTQFAKCKQKRICIQAKLRPFRLTQKNSRSLPQQNGGQVFLLRKLRSEKTRLKAADPAAYRGSKFREDPNLGGPPDFNAGQDIDRQTTPWFPLPLHQGSVRHWADRGQW